MSYATPATKTLGDSVTATEYNALGNNFEAGIPAMVAAKGDLIIATGEKAAARLAIGTDGQTLVSDTSQATGRKWANSGLVPVGGIVIWSGSEASIPANWHICNGADGTPDLMDKFLIGAGSTYSIGDTGGNLSINLQHSHTLTSPSATGGAHTHTQNNTSTDGAHSHAGGLTVADVDSVNSGSSGITVASRTHQHTLSGSTSSDGAHAHPNPVTGSAGGHTHTIPDTRSSSELSTGQSILPPCYALCFIMRMS